MIRLMPEGNEIIRMEIKMHLTHESIFAFLQKRGYEIKPWLYQWEDETFPGGTSYGETWSFTATKPDESQSNKNIFDIVFEKELKETLKDL